MPFEFDPHKSAANKKKHGISFEQAKKLWDDKDRLVVPAKTVDEPRFLLIGKTMKKHWSAVYAMRKGVIRLISVRRSRKEERDLYEG